MYACVLLVPLLLLGTGLTVRSEKHSLTYIYTALSKPNGRTGIHEFTAMGLLDGRMIDYYDSETQKKVPKQPWIIRHKPAEYWQKGSESRKSKHEWFKINIDILMKRMRENDTDVHVLQWMHGCEGEMQRGGEIRLGQVKDRYGWDGEDFLSFDDSNDVWVAPVNAAVETKRKWDREGMLKEYTKGYLEKECLGFLNDFVTFQQEDLKVAPSPEVYTFRKDARVETNTILMCMATGFLSEDAVVQIKQDGRILSSVDGFNRREVLPNEDETFQRTVHVEVLKSDKSTYTCEVIDAAAGHQIAKIWEDEPSDFPIAVVVGVIVGLVGLVGLVGIVVLVSFRVREREIARSPSLGSAESGGSGSTIGPGPTEVLLKQGSKSSVNTDSGVSSNSSRDTDHTAESHELMEEGERG